jgi:hypothetical protein
MNNNQIILIIEEYRQDAIEMLGQTGLDEWHSKGDIYEIDDKYDLLWYHYAILSGCPIHFDKVIDYVTERYNLSNKFIDYE